MVVVMRGCARGTQADQQGQAMRSTLMQANFDETNQPSLSRHAVAATARHRTPTHR